MLLALRSQLGTEFNTRVTMGGFILNMAQQFARPAAAIFVGVFLVVGGTFAQVSSVGSLPGDFFYPMKLTTEKIHVAVTIDKKDKANLQLELAKKRLSEIKQVVDKEKDPIKQKEKLEESLQNYKDTIAQVQIAMVNLAKTDEAGAAVINQSLKDVASEAIVKTNEAVAVIKTDVEKVDSENKTEAAAVATSVINEVIKSSSAVGLDAIAKLAATDKDKAKVELKAYLENLKSSLEKTQEVATIAEDTESTEKSVIEPVGVSATEPIVELVVAVPEPESVVVPEPAVATEPTVVVPVPSEELTNQQGEATPRLELTVPVPSVITLELVNQALEKLAGDDLIGALLLLGYNIVPIDQVNQQTSNQVNNPVVEQPTILVTDQTET